MVPEIISHNLILNIFLVECGLSADSVDLGAIMKSLKNPS